MHYTRWYMPLVMLAAWTLTQDTAVAATSAVDRPDTSNRNSHYISNRAPLAPSALIKLPIGSIKPQGWLRKQLELQAAGFHGHLAEISDFVRKEDNSWLSPTGEGKRGWEEVPYWLKGYLNCALVLGDKEMLAEAKIWIDGALASQKPDGWFGPDKGRGGAATRLTGRDDLWPNMIMLFCLKDYHSATGDERVIPLMTRYFKYLSKVPEDRYLLGYWPKMRGGDNLYMIYWLYNRTGEPWLLELAAKNHRRTARWDEDVINWHNVNMSQAFGEGTTWWMQSKNRRDLRSAYRNWTKIRRMYGQMPGGMFAGDENCRPGFTDPRQCVETCGMVEAMLSDEILIAITGDLLWADRCEDVAYNSLPAALTADMKALRYLTGANQVVSDARNHSPGIQNGGPMFHMNPHYHRCCQHNFGHGWPYFAQHLWYATPDNGLAAVFYNDCTVTAKVGEAGDEITIDQDTHYPFDTAVTFAVKTKQPVAFPLYLRSPGWCERPEVKVNGRPIRLNARPQQYIVLSRTWSHGDSVELTLPAEVKLRHWAKNHHAVSVDRGPLTYSLKIGEKLVRTGGTDRWPGWEILPTTPWNYALVLDADDPESAFEVTRRDWPADDMPWTLAGVPIAMTAKGKRILQWKLDRYGLCAPLQASPVRCDRPEETIELVPMGAARLRLSALPVVGEGPDAHTWTEPPVPKRLYKASASHCFGSDTADAIADGLAPKNSHDHTIARQTFWPHLGTKEWLQGDFDRPRTVRQISVYWFDDEGVGGCRVPQAWKAYYKQGDQWKPVTLLPDREYGTAKDEPNQIRFDAVTTTAVRIEIELREDFSGGVLEMEIDD